MENKTKLSIIKKAVTNSEAKAVGDKLGIQKDKITPKQFEMGMNIEREHGSAGTPETNETKDDPIKTGKIAWIHLKEIKDYYTRLNKMEKEGKKNNK